MRDIEPQHVREDAVRAREIIRTLDTMQEQLRTMPRLTYSGDVNQTDLIALHVALDRNRTHAYAVLGLEVLTNEQDES